MLSAPAAPDLTTRLLFAMRRIQGRDGTISDLLRGIGEEIRRREAEVVFLRSSSRVTIAVAIWAEDAEAGSILRTETRVRARGGRARRAFCLYWLLVGPFSALIRRRWLRAAASA